MDTSLVEDAVNSALREAVQSGLLTQTEKKEIRQQAFMAAQLDDNKDALF